MVNGEREEREGEESGKVTKGEMVEMGLIEGG